MAKTSRLPKKVRAQELAAERLQEAHVAPGELAAVPEDPAAPVVAAVPDPAPAPAAEPAPAPADGPHMELAPVEPVELVPADPASAEPAPAEPAPELDTDPVWKERYQALQGKYDAEIPQLLGTIDGLNHRVGQFERTPPGPPLDPAPGPTQSDPGLDASDRETYGSEFIDLVDRRARELVGSEIAKLTPQLQAMKGEVAVTRRETAQDRINARLDERVPDWRQINVSNDFKIWLAGEDAFTGVTRMGLLQSAHGAGQADRVVAIFQGYLSDATPAVPTTPQKRTVSLETLAAPGTTRMAGRGTTEPPAPIPVTREEIRSFYSHLARGSYKNHPEEVDRMEKRINSAVSHGLVT